ncbi:MAG: alpha/beta-hydrolase family protein, partial [Halocynthiibacter sp.]
DPAGVDPLEYIHAGDTAIVAIQYSNLPSWLTLLIDPDRSRDAARILFDEVYGYWATLPKDKRPKLYLHGLSLGALGSEASTSLIFILEDLIQGAVWSGPPFPSRVWSDITRNRNPGSPFWLPRFRDGSAVRFTGRENALDLSGAKWGPLRIAYIQHASDPMSFFSPDILFRRPDWLVGKRAPDISPYFTWYPIISFLQIAFDLTLATTVPVGYGHNFSTGSYIDAWVEVSDPKDWDKTDTDRLKRAFAVCGILPSPKYRCRP